MTLNQVADLLKMSRWTVYRLIVAGHLHGEQDGRNWTIPLAAYRDFLDRHTVAPTRKAAP